MILIDDGEVESASDESEYESMSTLEDEQYESMSTLVMLVMLNMLLMVNPWL